MSTQHTTEVTREMINAAHGVTMSEKDLILGWEFLTKIYLAMDALAKKPETSSSPCPHCEAFARQVLQRMDEEPKPIGEPIEVLGLPIAISYYLKAEGLHTVDLVCAYTPNMIERIPNIGKAKLKKLEAALWKRERHLKGRDRQLSPATSEIAGNSEEAA
jgi:DNA-directed RNA polymerase alpha subunit